MWITKEELRTHLFEDGLNAITGNDDRIVDQQIGTALNTLRRYLGAYDTDLIFSTSGADRDAYSELVMYAKDIAKWNLLAVTNANVNLELAKERYNDALKALQLIRISSPVPGWPLAATNTNRTFIAGSRPKFNTQPL